MSARPTLDVNKRDATLTTAQRSCHARFIDDDTSSLRTLLLLLLLLVTLRTPSLLCCG